MNFGGRLRFEREARGLTQADLCARAAALGHKVTQQDITSLERRDSRRSQHAPAICQALGVDLVYMLTGEGPRPAVPVAEVAQSTEKYEFVLRVEGAVLSAGVGSTRWAHEEIETAHTFSTTWLRSKQLRAENCRLLTVTGDSMSDRLGNGSLVMIDLIDRQIQRGKVYAIAVDGEQRIKRLFKQIDGSLLIRSDNPDKNRYPDETVAPQHLDRVQIIGRERWHSGDDD